MNKGAIKTFAIWARNKLMADVKSNAYLIGIREDGIQEALPQSTVEIKYFNIGSADPYAITGSDIDKRNRIISRLKDDIADSDYKTAYRNLLEHTASTWFNRLCAIRFMEVNEYFDDGLKVLSSSEEGKRESDLMSSPSESDLEFSDQERSQIMQWKLNNNSEELFAYLLKKKCRRLAEFLPGLFEKEDDCTDILVRFSIFDQAGIVNHLVNDIDEDDWKEQVQIIGWLYQFYNTEFKDETYRLLKKQNLTKDRIPSVTQLFTPEWIVKYMIENSLGRIWTDGHPESKEEFLPTAEEQANYAAGKRDVDDHKWYYYLEEAEQEPDVQKQLAEIRNEYAKLSPEDLSFIDPCLGSGHIVCYAFDVLIQIYISQGYTARDAVRSIIENNLYGLDIDERAYQLAYFSIMMKARQYDRGAFRRGLSPRVYAFEESNHIKNKYLDIFGADMSPIDKNLAIEQMKELLVTFKDAKELGSIIKVEPLDWELLKSFTSSFSNYGDITMLSDMSEDITDLQRKMQRMVNIGELLSRQYWVTCTNPPYMAPTALQKEIIEKTYREGKTDLCTTFILRLNDLNINNGIESMITMHSWMFLQSFKDLREKMLMIPFINLLHLGTRAFDEIGGEVVQTTSFVIRKRHINRGYNGCYIRLVDCNNKEAAFLRDNGLHVTNQNLFKKIPGTPIAYWVSKEFVDIFSNKLLYDETISDGQNKTGNNAKFVREFWEVESSKVGIQKKWLFYAKGGGYRKWYGNITEVVDWSPESRAFYKKDHICRIIPEYLWYREGITWSLISNHPSFRLLPEAATFDVGGSSVFFKHDSEIPFYLALLNSKVYSKVQEVVNPTINIQVKDVRVMPVVHENDVLVKELSLKSVEMCRDDWNSFEASWDFKNHPLIAVKGDVAFGQFADARMKVANKISECYREWESQCERRFHQLKETEEELNRIFIDIYGLQDELTPEVADEDVTVRKADLQRDVKSFISYAVGCMFGRYSLDVDGLAYAGGDWNGTWASKYTSFIPDEDNCIPITDENYFSDDIVGRFVDFVCTAYGEDTLEENLQFIADAIGGKGDDARDVIRRYFLNDFFKDHCKTYSVTGSGKRPIYWLFDSGKQNGFKALVYVHRWDANTIATVRTRYTSKVQEKYENELRSMDLQMEHLTDPRQKASLQKRKEKIQKQVAEVRKYDELIGHMALEYIDIDLDDGVKVNHEKVQIDRNGDKYQILAPIK